MQAGTQFWDESLAQELEQNKMTEASVDRSGSFFKKFADSQVGCQVVYLVASPHLYCIFQSLCFSWCRYSIVLFAGIAAEGLVYGAAEGGESDENLYKILISGLRPPWGPGRVSSCYLCIVFFCAFTFIRRLFRYTW
jgi:hypothetical protein